MNSDRIGPRKVQRPTLMGFYLVSPRSNSRLVAFLTSQLLFRLELTGAKVWFLYLIQPIGAPRVFTFHKALHCLVTIFVLCSASL
jgi:hypothetical protein